MKTKPLGNNVLIEVQREYDGVSRTEDNESMKQGKLIDVSLDKYHVTASAALKFETGDAETKLAQLESLIGKTVRWEEFAEGGQTFEEDGKTYALIPFWRLISYKETDNG